MATTDNRFMLADIASALECAPADLAGGEVPAPDRATASARAGVLGLRRALIVDLATDAALRRELTGDDNDKRIANAMVEIDAMARRAGFRYDGWDGFTYTGTGRPPFKSLGFGFPAAHHYLPADIHHLRRCLWAM